MDRLLHWLYALSWRDAVLFCTVQNFAVFFAVLAAGHAIQKWRGEERVSEPAPPLTRREVALAGSNVLLNCTVTVAGWVMWKEGLIGLRPFAWWTMAIDAAVLFVVMDFVMYVLHRVAHLPWLYPWMHAVHHRYDHPRPLTLFVMHPLETLSFGLLWLTVITIISQMTGGISFEGMLLYLTANVAFGLCGHLGVQPFPSCVMRLPMLRWLAGSQFHATHHADAERNFGFYSRIWDRLWKTGDGPARKAGRQPVE